MTESQVETTEVEETEEVQPEAKVVVDGRDYRVEGNDISGYVGVSPEYMTYANETEKPLNTAQEQWDLGLLNDLEGNMDEEDKKDESEESEVDESQKPVEDDNKESESDSESETPSETPTDQPSHNPPATVPGVFTPTVQ